MSKHKGVARDKSGEDSFPKGHSPRAGVRQKFQFCHIFLGGAVGGIGGEWHGRGTAAPPPAPPSYALVYTYRNIMYKKEIYRLSAHSYAVQLSKLEQL